MNKVQKPAEGRSQRLFRCIARSDNGFFEDSLHTLPGERGARRKDAFVWIAYQNRNECPERHAMRLQHVKAQIEREDETVAPSARLHARRLTRVVRGQLLIQGDDDGLFAREIAIQESDADPRVFRDVSKGRRLVPALRDQPDRGGIQAVPRRGPLGGRTRGTTPFSRLDILSEHVHYIKT